LVARLPSLPRFRRVDLVQGRQCRSTLLGHREPPAMAYPQHRKDDSAQAAQQALIQAATFSLPHLTTIVTEGWKNARKISDKVSESAACCHTTSFFGFLLRTA